MSPSRPYHENEFWFGSEDWGAEHPAACFCADYPAVRHFTVECAREYIRGRDWQPAIGVEWWLPVCTRCKPVVVQVCPSCWLALPAGGVCDECA